MSNPTWYHRDQLKRVCNYLYNTRKYALFMIIPPQPVQAPKELAIEVYTDSNWVASSDGRSTSGGAIYLSGFLISTWARTQHAVTLSSCEAELIAANTGATESMMVKSVLQELGEEASVRVLVDNKGCVDFVHRTGLGRMRHIRLRQLWLQEAVRNHELTVERTTGEENVADVFTKPMTAGRFEMLRGKIGVESYESPKDER